MEPVVLHSIKFQLCLWELWFGVAEERCSDCFHGVAFSLNHNTHPHRPKHQLCFSLRLLSVDGYSVKRPAVCHNDQRNGEKMKTCLTYYWDSSKTQKETGLNTTHLYSKPANAKISRQTAMSGMSKRIKKGRWQITHIWSGQIQKEKNKIQEAEIHDIGSNRGWT